MAEAPEGTIAELGDGQLVIKRGGQWTAYAPPAHIPEVITPPTPRGTPGRIGGLAGSTLQGAMFESADEARAAAMTGGDLLRSAFGGAFVDDPALRYRTYRDELRAEDEAFQQQHPGMALGGRVAGGAALGGLLGARSGAAGFASRHPWQAAAGGGALFGGLTGVGMAPEMEDIPEQAGIGAGTGAIMGPVSHAMVRGLATGTRALGNIIGQLKSSTTGRQEAARTVRRAFERDQTRAVSEVERGMRELGPEATALDVGGPNVRQLAANVATRPGAGQATLRRVLEPRKAGQFRRLLSDLQRSTGKSGKYFKSYKALLEQRAIDSAPGYKAAEEHMVSPARMAELVSYLDDQIDRHAGTSIGRALTATRRSLDRGDGQLKRNVGRELHAVKVDLSDRASSAYRGGKGNQGAALKEVQRRLLGIMDDASEDYQTARRIYSDSSSVKDAMEMGRRALREDTEELAVALGEMSDAEKDAFLLGATKAIRDKVGSMSDFAGSGANPVSKVLGNQNLRDSLRLALGSDEAFDSFEKAVRREGTFSEVTQEVLKNSETARRLAAGKTVGDIPTSKTGMLWGVARMLMRKMVGDDALTESQAQEIASVLVDTPADQIAQRLGRMRLPPDVYQKLVREFGASGAILGGYMGAREALQPER